MHSTCRQGGYMMFTTWAGRWEEKGLQKRGTFCFLLFHVCFFPRLNSHVCATVLLCFLACKEKLRIYCARYYTKCFICSTSFNSILILLFLLWQILVQKRTSLGKTMKLAGQHSPLQCSPDTAWDSCQGIPLRWPFWNQFSVLEVLWCPDIC